MHSDTEKVPSRKKISTLHGSRLLEN